MRRTPPVLIRAVLATGTLALSACTTGGSGGDATAPGTPSASGAASSAHESDPAAPSTASSSPSAPTTGSPLADEQGEPPDGPSWVSAGSSQPAAEDSSLVITDLRTGVHDGYDRVVVELSGEGTPGWSAAWVDTAYTQGKGDPISVTGAHVLAITGTGVTMPVMEDQQETAYTGPWDLTVGGPGIGSVHLDGAFEDQFQLVLGTSGQDYRIFTLSDPTRLVVDVRHAE